MLRPSCHECRFTSPERVGDITLADFWKYQAETFAKRGIENGVNLVVINSNQGKNWLDSIQSQLFCEKSNWKMALGSNKSFREPWKKPEKADMFWNDYAKCSFEEMVEKYCDHPGEGEFTARRRAWMNAHRYIFLIKLVQNVRRTLGR